MATAWARRVAAAATAGCLIAGPAWPQSAAPAPSPAPAPAETKPAGTGSASSSPSSASSPFARWFGGGDRVANSPVEFIVRVEGSDPALERKLRQSSLITGALAEGRTSLRRAAAESVGGPGCRLDTNGDDTPRRPVASAQSTPTAADQVAGPPHTRPRHPHPRPAP